LVYLRAFDLHLERALAINCIRGLALKAHPLGRRQLRRLQQKQVRTKVGVRVFFFFIAAALVLGALAISMNVRIEERAKQSHEAAE
jgi:hypothetical protein